MLTIYSGDNTRKTREAVNFFESKKTNFTIKKLDLVMNEKLLKQILEMVNDNCNALIKEGAKQFTENEIFMKEALENPSKVLKTPILIDWEKPEKGLISGFRFDEVGTFISKEQKFRERMELMNRIKEQEVAELQQLLQ